MEVSREVTSEITRDELAASLAASLSYYGVRGEVGGGVENSEEMNIGIET